MSGDLDSSDEVGLGVHLSHFNGNIHFSFELGIGYNQDNSR